MDTSIAGSGTPVSNFSYNVGSDLLFETVLLPDHYIAPYNAVFNASSGKLVTINLVANFNALLTNLNMKASPITNTTDYPLVADTIAGHIPLMFSYQQ